MTVNVYRPMVRGIHGSASENNEGIRAETMENCNKHEHKGKHKEGTANTTASNNRITAKIQLNETL